VRDIIWTVIIVWIVWKIYDAFKSVSKPKMQQQGYNNQQQYHNYNARKEGEVKVENSQPKHKPHFKDDDGEYVDYEEIK